VNALAPITITHGAGQQAEDDKHHDEGAHDNLGEGDWVLIGELVTDEILGEGLESVDANQVEEAAEDQTPVILIPSP